jgi:5'-nucleotidase (lipoprotein e(P4) family)
MRKIFFFLFIVPVVFACSNKRLPVVPTANSQDQLLLSVVWFQESPEMMAMYYQCYNNATKSLTEKLKNGDKLIPKAVVMDIDETILDNSPVEARQVITNEPYSDSLWNLWTDASIAAPLPGALEFTLFAQKQGVEIFYITNRSRETAFNSTISNLVEIGFPFADSTHLITKTNTSSKEERRQKVASDHKILLFIGDNIGDFDAVFDDRTTDLGFEAVKQNIEKFGDSYIILPNPMYGPWINAAANTQTGNSQHDKLLKSLKFF